MKKEDIFDKVQLLLAPVLVILLGLVLVFCPDSASALIAKMLGWGLGLVAAVLGISAVFSAQGRAGKVTGAIVCAVIGGWLGSHPLVLAAWFGRIVGIVLLLDGLQDIRTNQRMGRRFLLPVLISLSGLVLILMPMTASRLIFSACGVVVLVIGIVMLLDRLKGQKRLNGPQDPNIIDAL